MPSTKDIEAPPRTRRLDPERTKQEILTVARQEFAEHGLSGARVDAIAARTQTSKRMIYYYFGSKERLYLEVLGQAYAGIRDLEKQLELQSLSPVEAIRRMAEFTLDYHDEHPDFVRLVSNENIHHGKYIAQSEIIRNLNSAVIEMLADILRRGEREGVFRVGADPVDIHMMMSAVSFYRVSNRYTFTRIFQCEMDSAAVKRRHKQMLAEAVLSYLANGRRPAE